MDVNGYCCDGPQLQFSWKLGEGILAIDGIACLNCGADYVFDTKGDTTCPLIHRTPDGREVVLRVMVKPRTVQ